MVVGLNPSNDKISDGLRDFSDVTSACLKGYKNPTLN